MTPPPHTPPLLVSVHAHVRHARREVVNIPGLKLVPVVAILQQVHAGPARRRADKRQPGRSSFLDDDAPRLGPAGQHKGRGLPHQIGKISRLYKAPVNDALRPIQPSF